MSNAKLTKLIAITLLTSQFAGYGMEEAAPSFPQQQLQLAIPAEPWEEPIVSSEEFIPAAKYETLSIIDRLKIIAKITSMKLKAKFMPAPAIKYEKKFTFEPIPEAPQEQPQENAHWSHEII